MPACILLDDSVDILYDFKCVSLCKCVTVHKPVKPASVQHMAVWWLISAHWSLLICLTQCSHSPLPPHVTSLSTFYSQHTQEEEQSFCFLRSTCSSFQPSLLSISSSLTKSLFLLDTAENHMVCDIIRAGSRERGMVEQWERLVCQVSLQWCQQKSTLGGPLGGENRAGWKPYPFFSNFTPTWIIRD